MAGPIFAPDEAPRPNGYDRRGLPVGRVRARQAVVVRAPTSDSFQNLAADFGIGTDNVTSASTYGFNPITRNRTLLEWMHRGSWLAGVAIDVVGDDATRAGIDITSQIDPDDVEEIQRGLVESGVWRSCNDVFRWSRLYGGAIGAILIDGQRPETPLDVDTVGENGFRGIVPMDRWMVNPSVNDLVTEPGPSFGLPSFYEVVAARPQLPIATGTRFHHSRCIRMEGVRLPFWQRVSENFWGMSVFERLYDRMVAFDSATQGAAQLVYKAYIRTYKLEGFREAVANGGDQLAGIVEMVHSMRRFQGVEGITLLDKNDEFEGNEGGGRGMAGLADVLMAFGQQLSGALQVPLVRLFGQSPAGLNSSGESDLRTYYDGIKQKQEADLRIPMSRIIRAVAASRGIQLDEGFGFQFRPLWQLTEEQRGGVSGAVTQTVTQAFEAGIIGRATALKELRQSGRDTGVWTNITDQEIEDAEGEAPPIPGGSVGEAESDPAEGEAPAVPVEEDDAPPLAPAAITGASRSPSIPKANFHIHYGAPGEETVHVHSNDARSTVRGPKVVVSIMIPDIGQEMEFTCAPGPKLDRALAAFRAKFPAKYIRTTNVTAAGDDTDDLIDTLGDLRAITDRRPANDLRATRDAPARRAGSDLRATR